MHIRHIILATVYLGSAVLLGLGIAVFPSKPSVTSMENQAEVEQKADAAYRDAILSSNGFKYIVAGVILFLCTLLIQYRLQRQRELLQIQQARINAWQAPPVIVIQPTPGVVVHHAQ